MSLWQTLWEPANEDTTVIYQADVDDTPVNGVTTAPVSSNWAFDHAADLTAHGLSSAIHLAVAQATLLSYIKFGAL